MYIFVTRFSRTMWEKFLWRSYETRNIVFKQHKTNQYDEINEVTERELWFLLFYVVECWSSTNSFKSVP